MCNKEVHLLVISLKCCQNARCNNKKLLGAYFGNNTLFELQF